MTLTEQNILKEALAKGYVVFAPRGEKDLRAQYPELTHFPEFSDRNRISTNDMLFVWWFRCASSPLANDDDKDKVNLCIELAYPSEAARKERRERWKKLSFSPVMTAALNRMASINTSVRIRRYVAAKQLLDDCLSIITSEMPADPKGQSDHLTRAAKAHEIIADIHKELEEGSYGVEESDNTVLKSLKGILQSHRISTRK